MAKIGCSVPGLLAKVKDTVAGFSLKHVRVVLHHPCVPIFPLMWLFLIKKNTNLL